MNTTRVNEIVQAVLYEGYNLYPYRPSSMKNRQRFTFGRVYPEAYSRDQNGAERCTMQTQCLIEAAGDEAAPTVAVRVSFLHPMAREIGRLPSPLPALPDGEEPTFEVVPRMQVTGTLYQTWKQAVERTVGTDPLSLRALINGAQEIPFTTLALHDVEPIQDSDGRVIGVVRHRQPALKGTVEITAESTGARVFRLTVRVLNRTPMAEAAFTDRDERILHTFASTHAVLHAREGGFVSLMDPPAAHAEAAEACENDGAWPVLVGEEGERTMMLCSPIILYDYPEIAPESQGDLFDSTEIDELLTLRVMTMTDEEKREMRQADERGRQILERTEGMPDEHLRKMHGAIRGMRPVRASAGRGRFDVDTRQQKITVDGVCYRTGARVRLHPRKRGADIMDVALRGMTAVIQAVEQDLEGKVHLAVVVEDDPGRELGMMDQPGHRFFYSPEELELLPEEA